jgi:hypothetical protein
VISTDAELHYEPFHKDFGPLNMAMLYRFVCPLCRRQMALINALACTLHKAPAEKATSFGESNLQLSSALEANEPMAVGKQADGTLALAHSRTFRFASIAP